MKFLRWVGAQLTSYDLFDLMSTKFLKSSILGLSLLVTGCASVDPEFADPRDPYESYNRSMYAFNDALDSAILKPIGKGYNAIVPAPVNRGITNFFNNLEDLTSAVNNLLQLKVNRAFNDVSRVAINSTIGVLGFMDVASNMDLPRTDEDFGQTLGAWGAESGPYIVLPLLGPSSGRDAVGTVVDWFIDPIDYIEDDETRLIMRATKVVDKRADLLTASNVVEQAAIDPYAFVRDAYLQRRQNQVFDGNPPE